MNQLIREAIAAVSISMVAAASLLAGETQVSVLEGKVRVETEKGTIEVPAGHRGVLAEGREPTVTVDHPLVRDLIEMAGWLDEEKQAGKIQFERSAIQIFSMDNEDSWIFLALAEVPNPEEGMKQSFRLGVTTLGDQSKFYDMQGREIPFEVEEVAPGKGYIHLRLPEPIPPGGTLRLITLGEMEPPRDVFWKEGALWYVQMQNHTPNSLNYFRVILPESAVFVDSSRRPVCMDTVNGRTAVTLREFTGPRADSSCTVAFLRPEHNATGLGRMPPRYRGIRDERVFALAREYRGTADKIRAGLDYQDQSTPLRAVLTLYTALLRRDPALFRKVIDPAVMAMVDSWEEDFEALCAEFLYWQFEGKELLGTPPWPEHPPEGCFHPVFISRAGSLIREDTLVTVYRGGSWHHWGNMGNPRDSDVSFLPILMDLARLPSDGAGEEALKVYTTAVELAERVSQKKAQFARYWGELGLKLAGGNHWDQAMDAFRRCEENAVAGEGYDPTWHSTALVWQGHIHDLRAERAKAVEMYQAALQAGAPGMEHSQWGIELSEKWIRQRLQEPFTAEMMER